MPSISLFSRPQTYTPVDNVLQTNANRLTGIQTHGRSQISPELQRLLSQITPVETTAQSSINANTISASSNSVTQQAQAVSDVVDGSFVETPTIEQSDALNDVKDVFSEKPETPTAAEVLEEQAQAVSTIANNTLDKISKIPPKKLPFISSIPIAKILSLCLSKLAPFALLGILAPWALKSSKEKFLRNIDLNIDATEAHKIYEIRLKKGRNAFRFNVEVEAGQPVKSPEDFAPGTYSTSAVPQLFTPNDSFIVRNLGFLRQFVWRRQERFSMCTVKINDPKHIGDPEITRSFLNKHETIRIIRANPNTHDSAYFENMGDLKDASIWKGMGKITIDVDNATEEAQKFELPQENVKGFTDESVTIRPLPENDLTA